MESLQRGSLGSEVARCIRHQGPISLTRQAVVHFINIMAFIYFILFYFVFLPFLGPLPQHMEIPRLGVESEP